jgi:hypothetical protein
VQYKTPGLPLHPFTRAGLLAIGIFHFVMGFFCLAATASAVIYGFLPERNAASLLASLAGLALTPLYCAVAVGLLSHRPWSRTAGIVLGFTGAGLALLILLVGMAPVLHTLTISRRMITMAIASAAGYGVIAFCDLAVIQFLLSPRTKMVFMGSAKPIPWPDPHSPLELFFAKVFRVRY